MIDLNPVKRSSNGPIEYRPVQNKVNYETNHLGKNMKQLDFPLEEIQHEIHLTGDLMGDSVEFNHLASLDSGPSSIDYRPPAILVDQNENTQSAPALPCQIVEGKTQI